MKQSIKFYVFWAILLLLNGIAIQLTWRMFMAYITLYGWVSVGYYAISLLILTLIITVMAWKGWHE